MGILTNEEIKFLEDHKFLYEMIVKAGYCKNYTKDIYNTLSDIHTRYIGKHNHTHWCGDCRIALVKSVYNWYNETLETNYNNAMEVFSSLTNDDNVIETEESNSIDQPVKKKRGRKPKSQS